MNTPKNPCVIIDGRALSDELLLEIRRKIVTSGLTPGLAVILVGDDAPSKQYIRNKEKACRKVGIDFHTYLCGKNEKAESEQEIIEVIHFLNNDPAISGIIVQLPLPAGYNTQKIIEAIDPKKDADGFHPKNIEKILAGKNQALPPLVNTVLHILESQNIELKNKNVMVIGRSDVFTTIVKKALTNQQAHVSRLTLQDHNFTAQLKKADIVIPMLGQPEFLKGSMIKPGAVVIDIGVSKTADGYKGDCDLESIKKVASYATPTPGGVGPVTVAMLLRSVFDLAAKANA